MIEWWDILAKVFFNKNIKKKIKKQQKSCFCYESGFKNKMQLNLIFRK